MCADMDEDRLKSIKDTFLNVKTTKDYKDILNNKDIDAVCIATPTVSHYQIAKEALEASKHVLCEKPLSQNIEECDELLALSRQVGKVLMVGHVFLFNNGILWLKQYIDSGELGKVQYAYSTRTNLGPFRYDVNALWDLAPHDISIFNFLFGGVPMNVSGRGHKCLNDNLEDISFANLMYADKIMANIHVSWLDPKKVRQITIVGDKKMVVWDDLDSNGPIKIYDKHVEKTKKYYETFGEFQLLSKEGSIMIPKVDASEPLKLEDQFFLDCIEGKESADKVDAQRAADVVKVLCAVQESMDNNGTCINL